MRERFFFIAALRAGVSAFVENVTARPKTGIDAAIRGIVSLVGAGPGAGDLITLRGLERLRAADVVFYDRLAAPTLLRHARQFLTERGMTERLILATGRLRHERAQDWRGSAHPGTSLACHMAVAQAGQLRAGLLAAGWPKAALLTIVSKAQTAEEKVLHGSLDGLERLCTACSGLNPAMLLLRWPLVDQTAPTRYSANPAMAAPAST